MKKIQKIKFNIILFILIILFFQNLISQNKILNGDFGICRQPEFTIYATVKAVSIPFEGITSPKPGYEYPLNRVGQIQNGAYWRFYQNGNNPTINRNIAYITKIGNDEGNINPFMDFGHCAAKEYPQDNITETWGFAKYLIIYTAQQVSSPFNSYTFKFYINSLDSKYDDFDHGGYGADLYVSFEPITEENIPRIRFYKKNPVDQTIGYVYITDTVNGEATKEYKVWEVVPQTPVTPTKNFFAKTTPFPICPELIHYQQDRELELGTDVTLNGVYPNAGENDIYGYNTINLLDEWSYNYYTNPPIIPGSNVTGKTYVTPATYYEDEYYNKEYGFRLNVKTDNKITIINDHRLWVSGYNELTNNYYYGDTICFSPGSKLVLESYAQLNACFGGKIIDSSSNITWNQNAFMRIYPKSEIEFSLNENIIYNGGHIEVDGNGTYKVCDNSTVTFDRAGTYLKLNQNSKIILGENAKIEFKNGAYLLANGATFTSISGSTNYQGLIFEDAGALTKIENCTFNNAITPIKIINTSAGAGLAKEIKNNIFNIPVASTSAAYCIYAENVFNILIQNNTFNMQTSGTTVGVFIKDYFNYTSQTEEESNNTYNLNIVNNSFNNGRTSLVLVSLASSEIPFYVAYNNFTNTNSSYSLIGRMISGDIKGNTFSNNQQLGAVHLIQSSPNLLNNNIYSGDLNIFAESNSFPRMAPLINSNNEKIWIGGINQLSSSNSFNIIMNYSRIELDYGQNLFYSTYPNYNLYGGVSLTPDQTYYIRDNCFNNSNIPETHLWYAGNQNISVIPYFDGSTFNCNSNITSSFNNICIDKGFNILDTVSISVNTSSIILENEEVLYNQASYLKLTNKFVNAIQIYKNLINNFTSGKYLNNSLYDIFQCYQALDTLDSPAFRNNLYGELKTFLEEKINSENYDYDFDDIAFNFSLMCSSNMANYIIAADGFEFIALNNPDPIICLYASWDYLIVQDLINSSGGERGGYTYNNKYFIKELRDNTALTKQDPIINKIKKSYNKKKKEIEANLEIEIKKNEKNSEIVKEKIKLVKDNENKIRLKALTNIRINKSLSVSDREKRFIDDVLLNTYSNTKKSVVTDNGLIIPKTYSLSQNYPNPFNPVTNIKFENPKGGMVTLKVYDMLGREAKTLVNEIKQTGSYTVIFDASTLSSGIYFYKLTAGDFVQVKKMVLLK